MCTRHVSYRCIPDILDVEASRALRFGHGKHYYLLQHEEKLRRRAPNTNGSIFRKKKPSRPFVRENQTYVQTRALFRAPAGPVAQNTTQHQPTAIMRYIYALCVDLCPKTTLTCLGKVCLDFRRLNAFFFSPPTANERKKAPFNFVSRLSAEKYQHFFRLWRNVVRPKPQSPRVLCAKPQFRPTKCCAGATAQRNNQSKCPGTEGRGVG